jgi:hypothetical protein
VPLLPRSDRYEIFTWRSHPIDAGLGNKNKFVFAALRRAKKKPVTISSDSFFFDLCGDRWSRDRAGGWHVNLQQFQDGIASGGRSRDPVPSRFIGGLNFTCPRSDQVAL